MERKRASRTTPGAGWCCTPTRRTTPRAAPPRRASFTEGIEAFADLDAVVLGCSPDKPEKHRAFIAKHGLKLRLLSNEDQAVMAKYGAWGEKTMYGKTVTGVIRSTVLIDPSGRVAWHWPTVKARGHAAKVREKLEELRAAAKA
ncbi:MAG: peroxiredoxin [Myxococcales bacterium]|jgi:peroxiredoxin Q/BCP